MSNDQDFSHFRGKEAIEHIVEVQTEGMMASSEVHGAEMSGPLFAAFDAARDTALLLMLLVLFFQSLVTTKENVFALVVCFSVGWIFWKMSRSTWLAWTRLEQLHRIAKEEKEEIENHRHSEREELRVLYQAKGFKGQLLEDVIDVLMADGDRLLRVMLEEEMGFRLEEQDHPLIQGLGALVGATCSATLCLLTLLSLGAGAVAYTSIVLLALIAFLSAKLEKNRSLYAVFWNVGIGVFILVLAYSLAEYFT
jgi:hypothetical protein